MVKVRWDTINGTTQSVSSADGPGQHTDDVDINKFKDVLQRVPNINEEIIAEAVMKSYDGGLQDYRCHVIVDTYKATSKPSLIATTIAFVEIQDEEDKQMQFECDSCNSNKDYSGKWNFQVRNKEGWVYHDWCCPACGSIVNTDLVEMPKSQEGVRQVNELS